MTTTALPLSAGLIMISSLSCISLRVDLSVCVKLSVLGICTSTLCLISDLIRSMTDNVVYLLDCHVCGSQCVGEGVQPFNKRMNGHRSDLTKKTLLPVSQTLCRRDTHWMTMSDPKFISLTTIKVGKRIKDIQERVVGSASYKHNQKGLNLVFF